MSGNGNGSVEIRDGNKVVRARTDGQARYLPASATMS